MYHHFRIVSFPPALSIRMELALRINGKPPPNARSIYGRLYSTNADCLWSTACALSSSAHRPIRTTSRSVCRETARERILLAQQVKFGLRRLVDSANQSPQAAPPCHYPVLRLHGAGVRENPNAGVKPSPARSLFNVGRCSLQGSRAASGAERLSCAVNEWECQGERRPP